MTEKINKKIIKLFKLILTLNKKTEDDYFLDFAGHCNSVSVHVYRGGWSEDKDPEYLMFCEFAEHEGFEEGLDEVIKTLEEEARK